MPVKSKPKKASFQTLLFFYLKCLLQPAIGTALGIILLFLLLYGLFNLSPYFANKSYEILGIALTFHQDLGSSVIIAIFSLIFAVVAFVIIIYKRMTLYPFIVSILFIIMLWLFVVVYAATPIFDVLALRISAPRLCTILEKYPKSMRTTDQEFCRAVMNSYLNPNKPALTPGAK